MDTSMNSAIRACIPLLTSALADLCSPATLDALHVLLMSTLSAHLAPTWQPNRPTLGASLRTLRLSPKSNVPVPKPIRAASEAAGISCHDWILLLTKGCECEISIDPGLVSYRIGSDPTPTVYWQGTASSKDRTPWGVQKSYQDPNWMSDLLPQFPEAPRRSTSRSTNLAIRRPAASTTSSSSSYAESDASDYSPPATRLMDLNDTPRPSDIPYKSSLGGGISLHSRTNSDSSTGSSVYSALSLSMSQLSVSSSASASSIAPSTRSPSPACDNDVVYDQEEDEHAVVYVDSSRTAVTEYECGKVGVLGGAVMLGIPASTRAVGSGRNFGGVPVRISRPGHF